MYGFKQRHFENRTVLNIRNVSCISDSLSPISARQSTWNLCVLWCCIEPRYDSQPYHFGMVHRDFIGELIFQNVSRNQGVAKLREPAKQFHQQHLDSQRRQRRGKSLRIRAISAMHCFTISGIWLASLSMYIPRNISCSGQQRMHSTDAPQIIATCVGQICSIQSFPSELPVSSEIEWSHICHEWLVSPSYCFNQCSSLQLCFKTN